MDEIDQLPSRDEFVTLLWNEVVNEPMREQWIDERISRSEKRPDDPFADMGPLLVKLQSIGVTKRELSLLHRYASYCAVFATLYKLEDPGCRDAFGLYEDLLSADPSGLEGRPGSAP